MKRKNRNKKQKIQQTQMFFELKRNKQGPKGSKEKFRQPNFKKLVIKS